MKNKNKRNPFSYGSIIDRDTPNIVKVIGYIEDDLCLTNYIHPHGKGKQGTYKGETIMRDLEIDEDILKKHHIKCNSPEHKRFIDEFLSYVISTTVGFNILRIKSLYKKDKNSHIYNLSIIAEARGFSKIKTKDSGTSLAIKIYRK